MKATNRRGFLARIFAGAIAAPAVTKLIENGVAKPEGYGVTGYLEGGGGTLPYNPNDSVWVADSFGVHLVPRPNA